MVLVRSRKSKDISTPWFIRTVVLVPAKASALKKGTTLEFIPGIRRIINSNTPIEFSYGFKLTGYSYFTPIQTLAVHGYFL